MSDLVSQGELAYVRSLYPQLEISPLTTQQERLVLLLTNGYALEKAATLSGYEQHAAETLITQPSIQTLLKHISSSKKDSIEITRDMLNVMLLESHAKAATSTEEIMAVRELGKMNDLYKSDEKKGKQEVTLNVVNVKQIARMSDEDLFKVVGGSIIDGEVVDGDESDHSV